MIRHHSWVRKNTPWPANSVAVLSHGAGSTADFLARAFPPDRLGVADCRYVEDHSGDIDQIRFQLHQVISQLDAPVILGGVSLGGHAAAGLLASAERPPSAVAGLVCLPAWLGRPDDVAAMTAAAATDREPYNTEKRRRKRKRRRRRRRRKLKLWCVNEISNDFL